MRCHQKTCSQTWIHEAEERREDLILPPTIKFESNELNDGQDLPSNFARDESDLMQNPVSKSGIENETVNINLTTAGNHKEPSKVVNKAINYNHQNVTRLYRKLSDKLNSYWSKGSKTTESSQPADSIDPYEFVDDEVDQRVSHNRNLYRRNVRKKPKRLTTKPYFAASPKRHKKTLPVRKLGHKTDKTRLMEKLVGYTSEGVRNPTNTLLPVNPIISSNGKESTPTVVSNDVESGKLMTFKEYSIALKACLEESYSELKANRGATVTDSEKTVRRRKSWCKSKETVETEQSIGMSLPSGTSRDEVVKVLNKEPEKSESLQRDVDVINSDTVRKDVVSNSVDSGKAVTSKVDRSEQPESVLIVTKPESIIIRRRKSRSKSKDSIKQSIGMNLTSQINHEVVVKNGRGRTRKKRTDCKRAVREAKTEIKTVQLKEPEMVRNNQPELNNIFTNKEKYLDDRTIKLRKAKINRVDILDKEVIIRQQVTTGVFIGVNEDTNDLNKPNKLQIPISDTINVSKASTDNDLCKLVNNPVKYFRCSSDTGGSLIDQKAEKHLMVKLPNIRQFSSRSSLKLVNNEMDEQCSELENNLNDKKLAVVIKLERLNYEKLKKSTLKRKIAKSKKGNAY